ncbi:EamA family transporter [Kriegella aquimaris]|uniref:EamA-like transporter family protein n=1 Tax=Kriegella aquimaris TaxID=192904 RepID=A0A1G9K6R7_9FLAO|nr:DMT family transporter [Kriegella aquimaris]SDL45471.1 EamA-like transporter family protein [Kriegella aquimaris]
MLNLALSILFSTLIFVVFKLYSIYKVETLYAIITNYVVASSVGFFFYKGTIQIETLPEKPWFWGTLVLGVLFIVVFNLMAATSQKVGVSAASVATKMSLVIPVLAGVLLYNELLSGFQILGIVLALAAVYFASVKETSIALLKSSLILPLLVFLGSGIIDASIKFIQAIHISESEFPLFSATVFASAAFTGILFIGFKSIRTPLRVNFKNILGGIVLGILNYFSIYFILKALQHPSLNSAAVFTINNVAIVLFSTLLGIILFKERLSTKNWGGIVLAVISIALVALF